MKSFEISTYTACPNRRLMETVKCQHQSIDPKNNQCRDCYEDFNDYGCNHQGEVYHDEDLPKRITI